MTTSALDPQHGDLLSDQLTDNPFSYYAELREHAPVQWHDANKGWLLTRYEDVSEAYFDPRLSSDRVRPLRRMLSADSTSDNAVLLDIIGSWMVVSDPPAHTRLRQLANNAFRQQRVAAMKVWITELVGESLEEFIASGSDDFRTGVAYPLPSAVIARMMGAPDEDRMRFHRWSDELALVAFGAGGEDRTERHARALAGVREMEEYLHGLIERVRRQPGPDMVSALLEGTPDGDHLTDAELMSLCALLLFAGHETTTNLLCNAIVTLDRHPAERDKLRGDSSLVKGTVEEILRYEGPIKVLTRWVLEDHERHGQLIKAGQRVLLVQQAANRDPRVFTDPERFDITRPTQPLHLAFGRGIHACLGAQLARLEARIALPMVYARLDNLRLAEPVRWKRSIASRAVHELNVSYEVSPA